MTTNKKMDPSEGAENITIGDDVWNRVVQIIQEGMLTGTDVTDLMRQIRVTRWEGDPNVVHLTDAYRNQVREGHQRMIDEAKVRKEQAEKRSFSLVGLKDDAGSN